MPKLKDTIKESLRRRIKHLRKTPGANDREIMELQVKQMEISAKYKVGAVPQPHEHGPECNCGHDHTGSMAEHAPTVPTISAEELERMAGGDEVA